MSSKMLLCAEGCSCIFNLKTAGLKTGRYNLNLSAAGDVTAHAVQFQVK
jgi:hypothetical protein